VEIFAKLVVRIAVISNCGHRSFGEPHFVPSDARRGAQRASFALIAAFCISGNRRKERLKDDFSDLKETEPEGPYPVYCLRMNPGPAREDRAEASSSTYQVYRLGFSTDEKSKGAYSTSGTIGPLR
jgi:hypothetical protein